MFIFSEVLGAVLLDNVLEGDVVYVHAWKVWAGAMNCLFQVVASSDQTIRVSVLGWLAKIHQVFVKDAHVLILHALLAHLNLVRVRVGLVHPLIFEAVGSGILHGLILHVLQGHWQVDIGGEVFVEWVVRRGLAVEFLVSSDWDLPFVLLLDHFLQDRGR